MAKVTTKFNIGDSFIFEGKALTYYSECTNYYYFGIAKHRLGSCPAKTDVHVSTSGPNLYKLTLISDNEKAVIAANRTNEELFGKADIAVFGRGSLCWLSGLKLVNLENSDKYLYFRGADGSAYANVRYRAPRGSVGLGPNLHGGCYVLQFKSGRDELERVSGEIKEVIPELKPEIKPEVKPDLMVQRKVGVGDTIVIDGLELVLSGRVGNITTLTSPDKKSRYTIVIGSTTAPIQTGNGTYKCSMKVSRTKPKKALH